MRSSIVALNRENWLIFKNLNFYTQFSIKPKKPPEKLKNKKKKIPKSSNTFFKKFQKMDHFFKKKCLKKWNYSFLKIYSHFHIKKPQAYEKSQGHEKNSKKNQRDFPSP